ncbi:MAG TPA: proline racemase, partial [Marinobacter hydrocarbonoclasticus]|nr:proline racemase [Marinobacter nauticus]
DKLETVSLRDTGFIGEFTTVETEGDYQVVKNSITGKGYVIAHSDIVVNCDDPMVECDGLHHILSSCHKSSVV